MGVIVGIVSGVALVGAVYRRVFGRTACGAQELPPSAELPERKLAGEKKRRPGRPAGKGNPRPAKDAQRHANQQGRR